jgi:hypothetical protein
MKLELLVHHLKKVCFALHFESGWLDRVNPITHYTKYKKIKKVSIPYRANLLFFGANLGPTL